MTNVENRLHVNDKRYHVQPPPRSQQSLEELAKLSDVRSLVAQVTGLINIQNKFIFTEYIDFFY